MSKIRLDNSSANRTAVNEVEAFGGEIRRYKTCKRVKREQNVIPPTKKKD
jgi:hypothetical protein